MIEEQLRSALQQAIDQGRTMGALATEAGVDWAQLKRFTQGKTLTLKAASKLAAALGLELRPTRRRKKQPPADQAN